MDYLFDSNGDHIANFMNNQLHEPAGDNIGHYLEDEMIFIDMDGDYLGEIIFENRLLFNQNSPYSLVNFGNRGDYGNWGSYGDPGSYGTIGLPGGYEDIPKDRLQG